MQKKNSPSLFLTFDVEEWSLPEEYNLKSEFNRNTEFSRAGTTNLLNLLKTYNIKATFFVTGYFAEREPQIVRMIDKAGHEVASHAHCHTDLSGMNRDVLKTTIAQSTEDLSGLISKDIKGFRAPWFYINQDIINMLYELGYQYDSSIHPAIVPGHYYNWRFPLTPYFPNRNRRAGKNSGVLEIPISVIPLVRFPISWWWMRNIGLWVTHFGTDINLLQNRDVILYFHTWEFTKLPRIKGQPHHLIKGCGDRFLNRLEKFIGSYTNRFQFKPLKELAAKYL